MEFMNLQGKTIQTVTKEDSQITIVLTNGETIVLFTSDKEEIFIKTN